VAAPFLPLGRLALITHSREKVTTFQYNQRYLRTSTTYPNG
jgi:RHS Repeat